MAAHCWHGMLTLYSNLIVKRFWVAFGVKKRFFRSLKIMLIDGILCAAALTGRVTKVFLLRFSQFQAISKK